MTSKKFLCAGGETGGSVTPLLAIIEESRLEKRPYNFVWVGTRSGPERKLIAEYNIPFYVMPAGKWRRYVSWKNLLSPFFVLIGFARALIILRRLRPDAVLTAGGFMGVPLVWAAWCLGIPSTLHQQDARYGLANRLMRSFVSLETAVWGNTVSSTNIVIGNLVRPSMLNGRADSAKKNLAIDSDWPILLILGGGTGAAFLNKLVIDSLPLLVGRAFIIHITGLGKEIGVQAAYHYRQLSFATTDLADYLAAADLVVSRAGMGTLSELAANSKAAVVIPIPLSHQEANAEVLRNNKAAVVLDQGSLSSRIFSERIISLFDDRSAREKCQRNLHQLIPNGTAAFMDRLELIIGQ